MTEGRTATPGEPVDTNGLTGGLPLPEAPPGAVMLAAVTVVLYGLADGTEATAVAGTTADGEMLPTTTSIGVLMLGVADLTTPAPE